MAAARTRRGKLDEIGDGRAPRAPAPSRSAARRISAVASASGSARWQGRASVTKRCASAVRFAGCRPSSRRARPTVSTTVAATRLPGQAHRLVVEERHVEACVVRDEHGVACELEKATDAGGDRRSAAKLCVAETGERRHRRLERRARDWRASGSGPSARARVRAPHRSRRAGRSRVADRSSRGRRRRTWPLRAADRHRPARRARRGRPPSAGGRRPRTASSSSERASPVGTALPSFSTFRAASSAGTGPRRSSTSSTSRSAASSRSCIRRGYYEHMFVSNRAHLATVARAAEGPQGRVRGQLRERPDPPLPPRRARAPQCGGAMAVRHWSSVAVFWSNVQRDQPTPTSLTRRREDTVLRQRRDVRASGEPALLAAGRLAPPSPRGRRPRRLFNARRAGSTAQRTPPLPAWRRQAVRSG